MRKSWLKERHQLVLRCHECGSRHHLEDRFCARCGLALFAQPTPRDAPATAGTRIGHGALRAAMAVVLVGLVGAALALDRSPAKLSLAGLAIGDSQARVEKILGKPAFSPAPMAWKTGHSAVMWHYDPDLSEGGVPNLTVTFIDGQVRRVASLARRFATADGLRVGDTLDKARHLYGTAIEEDASGHLVPFKFIHAGDVVKVIVERGDPTLLAIGIETPDNVHFRGPARTGQSPKDSTDSPRSNVGLPYLGGDGGTSL